MSNRSKNLFFIGLFALATFLAIFGKNYFSNETVMIIQFGLIAIYLAFISEIASSAKDEIKELRNYLKNINSTAFAKKKTDLYRNMKFAVETSVNHAFLTYFHTKSPFESKNENEKKYHNALNQKLSNPSFVVKRIISINPKIDTENKINWMREEIDAADEIENYDLYFLNHFEENIPTNVQIFDDFVFIIDIARNPDSSEARDIHMKDKDIAEIYRNYFLNRLIDERKAKKINELSPELQALLGWQAN